jgi:hypothetical protein
MARHVLTFRGEAHEIPAGTGLCLRCMRLLTMEQWLDTECEPQPAEARQEEETA